MKFPSVTEAAKVYMAAAKNPTFWALARNLDDQLVTVEDQTEREGIICNIVSLAKSAQLEAFRDGLAAGKASVLGPDKKQPCGRSK